MNHEKHERHENKKQGVAPNVIRAERSEQETDSVICELLKETDTQEATEVGDCLPVRDRVLTVSCCLRQPRITFAVTRFQFLLIWNMVLDSNCAARRYPSVVCDKAVDITGG
ncbi:hypothetical protein MalM14_59450 [Gimesia chilikensis]|nr:hypothetical protein MalM14_59450 [Gimesia chilikensis]